MISKIFTRNIWVIIFIRFFFFADTKELFALEN